MRHIMMLTFISALMMRIYAITMETCSVFEFTLHTAAHTYIVGKDTGNYPKT